MQSQGNKVYQIMFSERRFEQMGNLYVLTKRNHQLKTKREWYSMVVDKFIESHPSGFKIRYIEIPTPYEVLTIMNAAIKAQRKKSRIGSKSPLIQEAMNIKIEQSFVEDFKVPKKASPIPEHSSNAKRVGVSTWVSEETFNLINQCVEKEKKMGLVQSKQEWIIKATVEYLEQSPTGFKRRGTHFHIDQSKIDRFLKIQRKINRNGSVKQIINEAFNSEIIKNYSLLYHAGLA